MIASRVPASCSASIHRSGPIGGETHSSAHVSVIPEVVNSLVINPPGLFTTEPPTTRATSSVVRPHRDHGVPPRKALRCSSTRSQSSWRALRSKQLAISTHQDGLHVLYADLSFHSAGVAPTRVATAQAAVATADTRCGPLSAAISAWVPAASARSTGRPRPTG